MKELENVQITELKDLLAKETINYYKLVGYGASIEECKACNGRIRQMELELASRRNLPDNNILMQRYEPSAA